MSSCSALMELPEICRICSLTTRSPKLLPCLHTYCKECVEQLVIERKTDSTLIKCPACSKRCVLEDLADLPRDYIMEERIRKHSVLDSLNVQEQASKEQAEQDHICSSHIEKFCHFCFTCNSLLCPSCINEHAEHEFASVAESASVKRAELEARLAHLTQNTTPLSQAVESIKRTKQAIDNQAEEVTYQIYTTFGRYIRSLQEREKQLIAEVEELQHAKNKVLDLQLKDLHKDLETMSFTSHFTETCVEESTAINLLRSHETILSRLEELSEGQPVVQPLESDDIRFVSEEVFIEATQQLGRIEGGRQTFASMSRLSALPVRAVCGETVSCTLYCCDALGQEVRRGGDHVMASLKIKHTSHRQHVTVTENEEGTYYLTFVLNDPGEYALSVGVNGKHIPESPFSIMCYIRRDYAMAGECLVGAGRKGDRAGELLHPISVCLDSLETLLYISDSDNHRIQLWSYPELEFISCFGCHGEAPGELQFPYGLCADEDLLYVADCKNHRIQVFDRQCEVVRTIGCYGSEPGQFNHPYDVKVRQGRVFVSDSGNHRIQVLTTEGDYMYSFGIKGVREGQFGCPWGLALDDRMRVIVADFKHSNIQIFDAEGTFLSRIEPGLLNNPAGVTVDREGNVLVCDRSNHSIQVFDHTGSPLARFCSRGSGPCCLRYPTAVIVDRQSRVVVCDSMNHRVQIF